MTSELERQALVALRQLKAKLEATQYRQNEPIAVVGIGCRFPGGVSGPDDFWRLLRDGRIVVGAIGDDRWNVTEHFDPDPAALGKMSTRSAALIHDADRFDAAHFGISDEEAAAMDPQQRLLVEVAHEALEDAGMAPRPRGEGESSTGVFVGIYYNDFLQAQTLRASPERLTALGCIGNLNSIAVGRLAFVFGLRGPNLALDSACSSSLTAVHLACNSLRAGECESALAGGVNLILGPDSMIRLGKAQTLAADGRSKPFDEGADGIGRGEGAGLVVLKRLSDALAARDRIYAVVTGSALTQGGGRRYSLTSPYGSAVVDGLRIASEKARDQAIGYVECHASGTPLGDSQEAEAVSSFVASRGYAERVPIGSTKANIGHLEPAAGIASFIKTVLSVHHGEIPPLAGLRAVNPYMQASERSIVVATERRPWPAERRRAAINAIGVGGTNAHVVVEAAPESAVSRKEDRRPVHLLPLSARSEPALRELARRYREMLATVPSERLGDLCHAAGVGRAHERHRTAFVVSSREELVQQLEAFEQGREHLGVFHGIAGENAPRIAFLCSGQGSQTPGMGAELHRTHPVVRERLEAGSELLRSVLDRPLLDLLVDDSDDTTIHNTCYAQPALYALECALIDLWRSWGVRPDALLGHSVGEYSAAYGAGVFELNDGLRLIATRGQLIQRLPHGSMLAIAMAQTEAEALLRTEPALSLAAVNGADRVVVSGETAAIERLESRLRAEGRKVHKLSVSHAFHSSMMEPALPPFEEAAASIRFASPETPLVSNVSGRLWSRQDVPDAAYWRRHIREPVLFGDGLKSLVDEGFDTFIEVGPQPVLLSMAKSQVPSGTTLLASLDGRSAWTSLLEGLARLYIAGVDVDWRKLDAPFDVRNLSVPGHPLERRSFPTGPRGMGTKQEPAIARPGGDDEEALSFSSRSPWEVYEQTDAVDRLLGSTSASPVRIPRDATWYVRHPSTRIDDASLEVLLSEVAQEKIPGLSLASCRHLTVDGIARVGRTGASLLTLDLFNTAADDATVEALGALTELRSLVLAATKVGATGCARLAALPGLARLHLGWTETGDEGLEELRRLTGLKALVLRNTTTSVRGLKQVASIPSLEVLSLRECPVDDDALAVLAPLVPRLTRLDLGYTNVTEASLPLLRRLASVECLVLRGTRIDRSVDASLVRDLPKLGAARGLIR